MKSEMNLNMYNIYEGKQKKRREERRREELKAEKKNYSKILCKFRFIWSFDAFFIHSFTFFFFFVHFISTQRANLKEGKNYNFFFHWIQLLFYLLKEKKKKKETEAQPR